VAEGRHFRLQLAQHVTRAQRAVSCVTQAVVLTDGQQVWLAGAPVRLAGPVPFLLTVQQDWQPKTVGARLARYNYRLVDATGLELAAYHRHGGRHDYDHVHTDLGPFPGVAMPTGEVPLELVIAFCIELGVEPIRDDWEKILGVD
jgi:hypothetical protein